MKLPIIIFLLFELLVVSYLDLKYKKISNYWIILNLTLVIILYIFFRDQYILDIQVLIYPILLLVAGFIFFAIGIMGGGDAKFLFSFYLMLPLTVHYTFFTKLLIATIAISFFNLSVRGYKNRGIIYTSMMTRDYKSIARVMFGRKMPYAPVIMIAWVLFILEHLHENF